MGKALEQQDASERAEGSHAPVSPKSVEGGQEFKKEALKKRHNLAQELENPDRTAVGAACETVDESVIEGATDVDAGDGVETENSVQQILSFLGLDLSADRPDGWLKKALDFFGLLNKDSTERKNFEKEEKQWKKTAERLKKHVEKNDAGKRLMAYANASQEKGVSLAADSCWDWIDKLHKEAGICLGPVVYQAPGLIGRNKGPRPTTNEGWAPTDVYAVLKSGSWLYIKNNNSSDVNGEHSVLFDHWVSEAPPAGPAKAIVLGYTGGTSGHPKKYEVDFTQMPIHHVRHPGALA